MDTDAKVQEIMDWLKIWGDKPWPPDQQKQAQNFLLDLTIPYILTSPPKQSG